MSEFYSHIYRDKAGKIIGKKLLKEHIQSILNTVRKFYHYNDFTHNYFHVVEAAVKLHDLGKYTRFFQDYLVTRRKHQHNHHHHTLTGAVAIQRLLSEQSCSKNALIGFIICLHHHSNLKDISYCYENLNNELLKVHKTDLTDKLIAVKQDIGLELGNILGDKAPDLFSDVEDLIDESNVANYFLTNYLFSLLIEADKLDASKTIIYTRKKINANSVDEYVSTKIVNSLSLLRSEIRKAVISNLDKREYIESRLFTLTAPTGAGKTLAALDFAVKLKDKIESGNPIQIIYGLPFINIIEQNFDEYKKALPDCNVLAHYQFADVFEQTNEYDEEKGKRTGYGQRAMLLDTWQSDVVITSFVQLLQTLIGNRNRLLKKFHHFANSIIILDEVQTLKLGQLPLIGTSLYYLAKFLDARIILMTATRPLIFELANKWVLKNEGEISDAKELLPSYPEYFRKFNRTKIVPLLEPKLKETKDFIRIFEKKWRQPSSCLIVCNTVNRSLQVLDAIGKYLEDSKYRNPLFYLSTNVIPAHRQQRIKEINIALKTLDMGKKPILVCTQVVEAGVNLDFDMGFRDLGPLDAIIQVAGRINRENDNKKQESPLYVIDFGDCDKVYNDKITSKHAKRILNNENYKNGVSEKHYLEMISEYFQAVSEESEFSQSLSIFNAMKRLNYEAISDFQVIEEKHWAVSIFIELDEIAIKATEAFQKLKNGKISFEEFQQYKKNFHQRIVVVPKYLEKVKELEHSQSYLGENILWVKHDLWNDYYDERRGFKREKEDAKSFAIL